MYESRQNWREEEASLAGNIAVHVFSLLPSKRLLDRLYLLHHSTLARASLC